MESGHRLNSVFDFVLSFLLWQKSPKFVTHRTLMTCFPIQLLLLLLFELQSLEFNTWGCVALSLDQFFRYSFVCALVVAKYFRQYLNYPIENQLIYLYILMHAATVHVMQALIVFIFMDMYYTLTIACITWIVAACTNTIYTDILTDSFE